MTKYLYFLSRKNFFGGAHVLESHSITIKNSIFVNNSALTNYEVEASKGLEKGIEKGEHQ